MEFRIADLRNEAIALKSAIRNPTFLDPQSAILFS
jgi:hypothetical protein